jgi:hypothetical protein
MRIIVIVPSKAHKQTAGVRIRYDRLSAAGVPIKVEAYDDLAADIFFDGDVYIFSKTYSAEAGVAARKLREMGKVVGIDLFDDYFSQLYDSRLQWSRDWLRRFGGVFDFALCSTEVIRQVAEIYMPNKPLLVLPDPFPKIDVHKMASMLVRKLSRAHQTRAIPVAWFGIGSNPYFSVGISDLAAYSSAFAELEHGSFSVNLTVLTDRLSLTANNLARLSKLPVQYKIKPWSLEAEEQVLADSLVSFIPVNGQSFSRAKSLNRALSAISAGTQVLSSGYPLYSMLDSIIYRSASALLSDIELGECRIRGGNIEEVERLIRSVSSLSETASEVLAFLNLQIHGRHAVKVNIRCEEKDDKAPISSEESSPKLSSLFSRARKFFHTFNTGGWSDAKPSLAEGAQQYKQVGNYAILHGVQYDKGAASLAKAAGILSVKTPLTKANFTTDIYIKHLGGKRIEIWICPDLKQLVNSNYRDRCSRPTSINKQTMIRISVPEASTFDKAHPSLPRDNHFPGHETVAYRDFIRDLKDTCARIFPTIKFYLSDPNMYSRSTLVPERRSAP